MIPNGWMTYLCIGAGVVVLGLEAAGIVPQGTADRLLALFGLGSVAGLRRAIANKE